MSNYLRAGFLDNWMVIDGYNFGQPEGSPDEWRQIVAAIKENRNFCEARRCDYQRNEQRSGGR